MDINEYAEIRTQEWLEPVETEDCGDCHHDCANCPDLPEMLRERPDIDGLAWHPIYAPKEQAE